MSYCGGPWPECPPPPATAYDSRSIGPVSDGLDQTADARPQGRTTAACLPTAGAAAAHSRRFKLLSPGAAGHSISSATARSGPALPDPALFGSARPGSARLFSASLVSARLRICLTRLVSFRLVPAQLIPPEQTRAGMTRSAVVLRCPSSDGSGTVETGLSPPPFHPAAAPDAARDPPPLDPRTHRVVGGSSSGLRLVTEADIPAGDVTCVANMSGEAVSGWSIYAWSRLVP